MNDHDHGYKRLFSHPEMIRDLLTGFVPAAWVADLDFGTLEKYPTEFIDDRLRDRRGDVIWRVRWRKDWIYLYLLLEFQSGVHPFMAARLFTYVDLLYQDLIRNRHLGRRRRLPPVLPIVLYNGRRRWTAPTDLGDLIESGPLELTGYQPRLRYLLVDESAYADADLAAMRNLVAALFRLENSRGPEPVREVLSALTAWLADPGQADLRRSLVLWLREAFLKTRLPAVQFPELSNLEEIRIMLTERVLDWTQQWKQEGLQQGRQEGLQQGLQSERGLITRQVRRRFGAATAERSAPLLARVTVPETLEQLGEALLDCADGESWLAILREQAGEG